jgi:uncharacterized membrane protein
MKIHFKRNFLAGLAVLLPIWLTFVIVWLVFKWVSSISMPVLLPVSKYYFGKDWGILVNLVSFILTVFIIWFVGVMTTILISKNFFAWIENLMIKIPLLSSIYTSIRKLTQYIFGHGDMGFKSVGIVEFPKTGSYALCFVIGTCDFKRAGKKVKVFVPSGPSPATGFLLFGDEAALIPLAISLDNAIRAIISGGIVMPEMFDCKTLQKHDKGN